MYVQAKEVPKGAAMVVEIFGLQLFPIRKIARSQVIWVIDSVRETIHLTQQCQWHDVFVCPITGNRQRKIVTPPTSNKHEHDAHVIKFKASEQHTTLIAMQSISQ